MPGARQQNVTLTHMTVPVEVDCVVVSYNSSTDLPDCLTSLTTQEHVRAHITVVDNNSTDDSVATARRLGASVVANPVNRGFANAVNQGAQSGSAPWILVFNPDARMRPGALRTLIDRTADDDRTACVGPRTLDADGDEYPSRRAFPNPIVAAAHALLGSVWPGNPATRVYHAHDTATTGSAIVDWVSGSCMLLRRKAFDAIGGFDRRYFMYIEDMDLCLRFARASWHVMYEPKATIVHIGGRSSRHRPVRSIYHHHRGAALFYWRLAPAWHRVITAPLATLLLGARCLVQILITTARRRRG